MDEVRANFLDRFRDLDMATVLASLQSHYADVTWVFLLDLGTDYGVFLIAALGLYVLMTAGQVSLGHAGMLGVTSYGAAVMGVHWGMPFWLILPLSGVFGLVTGAAYFGLLGLRLGGFLPGHRHVRGRGDADHDLAELGLPRGGHRVHRHTAGVELAGGASGGAGGAVHGVAPRAVAIRARVPSRARQRGHRRLHGRRRHPNQAAGVARRGFHHRPRRVPPRLPGHRPESPGIRVLLLADHFACGADRGAPDLLGDVPGSRHRLLRPLADDDRRAARPPHALRHRHRAADDLPSSGG